MKQFTDTPFTLTISGVDMTTVTEPHVTFKQGYEVVDKTPLIVNATTVSLTLTQAETGRFREGSAEIQLNFVDSDGDRRATDIAAVPVEKNILRRVIEDG